MFVTENLSPLALLSELLCGDLADEESTRRFADLAHNKDLCPDFRKRILRIFSTYQKHRFDVHDVQAQMDKGVDVFVSIDGDDGPVAIGLQIKSDKEIVDWKAGRSKDFISRLRNQYTQALQERRIDQYYLVLCADAVAHRDHLREITTRFAEYDRLKIVMPDAAFGFFGMSEIELDVAVTRLLCARDFVLKEAQRAVGGLPPGGLSLAIDLIFRALAGETKMTHEEYSELVLDAAGMEDDADPERLTEAMNRSLVEDVGVHDDYRIVPDAIPAVCALYYDQLARHGDPSAARARTSLLLSHQPGAHHRGARRKRGSA